MKFFQVDTFTQHVHHGNPAAVCFLTKAISAEKMQLIAAEVNQPATAFVQAHADPFANKWQLRWFTPTKEYALCGHATLGAAFMLWSEGIVRPDRPIRFQTEHHLLTCTYNAQRWISMRFPAQPVVPADPPAGLLSSLGIADALFCGRTSTNDYVIEVSSPSVIRDLAPDFAQLSVLDLKGVTVTALAHDQEMDFVSRYFSAENAKEDPVTGTAHCRLAPYWSEKLGKNKLVGFQASQRGGLVRMEVVGDDVVLGGQAVMVIRGEMLD